MMIFCMSMAEAAIEHHSPLAINDSTLAKFCIDFWFLVVALLVCSFLPGTGRIYDRFNVILQKNVAKENKNKSYKFYIHIH